MDENWWVGIICTNGSNTVLCDDQKSVVEEVEKAMTLHNLITITITKG